MPDGGEILATRVAFLELKDERRLIQEGYELLDEKRVLLATEIMRQLRHYATLQDGLRTLEESMATGWNVLRGLPHNELARLSDAQIKRHLEEPAHA